MNMRYLKTHSETYGILSKRCTTKRGYIQPTITDLQACDFMDQLRVATNSAFHFCLRHQYCTSPPSAFTFNTDFSNMNKLSGRRIIVNSSRVRISGARLVSV